MLDRDGRQGGGGEGGEHDGRRVRVPPERLLHLGKGELPPESVQGEVEGAAGPAGPAAVTERSRARWSELKDYLNMSLHKDVPLSSIAESAFEYSGKLLGSSSTSESAESSTSASEEESASTDSESDSSSDSDSSSSTDSETSDSSDSETTTHRDNETTTPTVEETTTPTVEETTTPAVEETTTPAVEETTPSGPVAKASSGSRTTQSSQSRHILFIQMEYYKNGTLADLIQSGTVGAGREHDG